MLTEVCYVPDLPNPQFALFVFPWIRPRAPVAPVWAGGEWMRGAEQATGRVGPSPRLDG